MRVRDFAEYVDSLYVKIYGTIPNDQLQDNGDIPLAIPHEEIRMSVFMDGLNPSIKTILWQNLKPPDTFCHGHKRYQADYNGGGYRENVRTKGRS